MTISNGTGRPARVQPIFMPKRGGYLAATDIFIMLSENKMSTVDEIVSFSLVTRIQDVKLNLPDLPSSKVALLTELSDELLILTRGDARALCDSLGENDTDWIGKHIRIRLVEREFDNVPVWGVSVTHSESEGRQHD